MWARSWSAGDAADDSLGLVRASESRIRQPLLARAQLPLLIGPKSWGREIVVVWAVLSCCVAIWLVVMYDHADDAFVGSTTPSTSAEQTHVQDHSATGTEWRLQPSPVTVTQLPPPVARTHPPADSVSAEARPAERSVTIGLDQSQKCPS